MFDFFETYKKNELLISHLKAHPHLFPQLIKEACNIKYDKAWRCAMLIGHLMDKNDSRILPHINSFITALANTKSDGLQRQILVILDQMNFTEDQEGILFNHCLTIWETLSKIPSTRIRAFWMMEKISTAYPELQKELQHFTTPYYTETLSPGIKAYFSKKRIQL